MWQFWLIVAGVFFVFEMITVGFLVFWLGVAALLTMIVSIFIDNIIIQTTVFVIASAVLLLLTKPFVDKYVTKKDTVATNAFAVIGKKGIVTKKINSLLGTGQVKIDGEVWTAKTEKQSSIEEGAEIEVVSINGVKAVVKLTSDNSKEEVIKE